MLPVQITIRNIPHSQVPEELIHEKAQKLNQFCKQINSCRIVLSLPQRRHHTGSMYSVKIDLTVPGKKVIVSQKLAEDVRVAIRDAFDALERQLEDYARRQQRKVKNHESVVHGKITKIIADEHFGFIQGNDEREYYFSAANVAFPSFAQLTAGEDVDFIVVTANDGLQANRVTKRNKSSE